MPPISSQLPVDIPSLEDITGASRAAISAQSAAATLPMELRQALTSRITGEHPLVKEREESLQRAITSGPRVREELLNISRNRVPLSPTSQFAIESARKASDIVPLSTANMLLGLQFGNINDVVESGSRIAQAESARKVQEASLLQATRQNALDELFRQADLDLKLRQFSLEQQKAGRLKQERMKVSPGDLIIDPTTGEVIYQAPGAGGFSGLNATARNNVGNLMAFLDDAKSMKRGLETGGKPPSGFGQLLQGLTGPIASLFGQQGSGGQLRSDISNFEASVKNKRYGGALTESEIKEYNKWGPSTGKQELTNYRRINTQIISKTNELKNILKANGVDTVEVREISTGQLGTIPVDELDLDLYELTGQ